MIIDLTSDEFKKSQEDLHVDRYKIEVISTCNDSPCFTNYMWINPDNDNWRWDSNDMMMWEPDELKS